MTPSFAPSCQACLAPVEPGAETCAKCGALIAADPTGEEASRILDELSRALEGTYKIGEVIGAGRGGITTHAIQLGANRDLAIKVSWNDAQARTQMLRETVLTGKITHSNVLPMRDIQAPDSMFVVEMQLATGGTVADLVADGKPVPYKRVLEIVRGVAGALDQAHAAGIIHGGLRPVKILLDGEGHPLLTDFAIRVPRRADWDITRPSEVGAQAYMPLEQRHDSPTIDGRVDQYALAIIAYELLRGQPTWRINHEGVLEIDALDILVHRPIAPDAPLSASTAIKRATAKDPTFRYTSVNAFLQAFSGEAAEATGIEHIYRDQVVLKQQRSMLWVGVPATLAVLLLAIQPSVRGAAMDYWDRNWSAGDKRASAPDLPSGNVPTIAPQSTPSSPRRSDERSASTSPSTTTVGVTTPTGGSGSTTLPSTTVIPPGPSAPPRQVGAVDPGVSAAQQGSKGRTGSGSSSRGRASNFETPRPTAVGGEISKGGSGKTDDTRPGFIAVSLDADARAAVIIDGKPRGLTPLTVTIGAGKHTVSLGGGTYSPSSTSLEVSPGDTVRATFGPGRKP
jgi:serine/threonine protein kinase